MPAKSKAQARFMGAEYGRAKAGKATKSGISAADAREFAATPRKGLPARKKGR